MNVGDIGRWSCTKLRHFFESKSPNWMVDNLDLQQVSALQLKLRECSGEVARKVAPYLKMVKSAIMARDRRG